MHDQSSEITGGVDTHGEVHVAAAVDGTGRILATQSFAATAAGYRALLGWLGRHGRVVRVGMEGTGSYGAGLAEGIAGLLEPPATDLPGVLVELPGAVVLEEYQLVLHVTNDDRGVRHRRVHPG